VIRFKLASAIRPDELVGKLRLLAADPSVGVLATEIKQLLDVPNPEAERQIRLMTETTAELNALAPDPAQTLIEEAVKAVCESAGYLEACFKMMMDRVSRQFTTYIRLWTIILSLFLAIYLGLDVPRLISNQYTKEELRETLKGSAQNVQAAVGKLLPADSRSDRDAAYSLMAEIYTGAIKKTLALANVQANSPPQDIRSRVEGVDWLRRHVPPAQQAAAINAYSSAVDQGLGDFITSRANDFRTIEIILRGFGIQPSSEWPRGFNWQQLFGCLFTGALLSLAAPIWFNGLKAVTNLWPIIASKQAAERQASF
jgi:hypothetical protein